MANRWALLLLVLAAVGCGNPQPDDSVPGSSDAKQDDIPGQTAAKAAAKPVTIQTVDKAGFDAVLAQHAGKVIVVDYWATWCEPCKESFPHLVELSGQFSPAEVAFVSVSLDTPDSEAAAVEFLTGVGAHSIVNLRSELDAASAFEAHDIRGGIPNYSLYGRDGKLLHQFALYADEKLNLLDGKQLDIELREALAP